MDNTQQPSAIPPANQPEELNSNISTQQPNVGMPPPTQPQVVVSSPGGGGKAKKLAIAFLAVLVLVGAAVGATMLLKDKPKPGSTDTNTNTNQTQTTDANSPKEVISKLESEAIVQHGKQKAKYTYEAAKADATSGYDPTEGRVIGEVEGVNYKVESDAEAKGGFYHTINNVGTDYDGMRTAQEATQKVLLTYIVDTLGFKKEENITISGPATDFVYANFSKGDTLCAIPTGAGYTYIGANCITKDKLASAAKTVKPFVDLYLASDKKYDDEFEYYGISSVKDGANSYKITTVSTNSAPLKFVKTDSQKEWKFAGVLNFQSPSDCKDFEKDTDVRKAYEGTGCIENGAERKVK